VRSWWRDFLRLAGWSPGLATIAVVLGCVGALLEGLGLAALIPALSAALPGAPSPGGLFAKWMPSDRSAWPLAAVVVFVSLACAGSLARLLAEAALLRLRTGIERRARETMGRALMQMSWPAFLGMRLGDISKAQVIEGMQMGVGTQVFVQALAALAASIAYLAVAISISVPMTLITMAFGVAGAGLYVLVGRWARKHADSLSSIVSSIGERVSDVFFGLKFIRATGLVPEAEREDALRVLAAQLLHEPDVCGRHALRV
jgi:ABC-type multidrug transport system fused ATPase/permease subunit